MLLSQDIINRLTKEALDSPRLRMNYNLHESYDDSVQRMFNAIEPNSIIPIARHQNCSETIILLKGKLRILIYNDCKEIREEVILNNASGNFGYHIPKGVWHRVESLESGTVLFETREGPYQSVKPEDILK